MAAGEEENWGYRAGAAVGARRKGSSSMKTWLVMSVTGGCSVEEAGKHSIMRRTGLPARDLRVLDPLLSYPSTILGRENAIVINLEHIKAIITATEVFVPNSTDPLVVPFVNHLHSCLANHTGMDKPEAAWPSPSSPTQGNQAAPIVNGRTIENNLPILSVPQDPVIKSLPFEFRVLEICLESACRGLESETTILEQEAYPALDELTSKINNLNLERVRQIKSRQVAISGRVQKVRDELEHLLDDDMDMAEMNLTKKYAHLPTGESPSRTDLINEALQPIEERNDDSDDETENTIGNPSVFKPKMEELEMLLDAYFVQIDCTLNKLSTLREYIDDTEDYINIMLDEKQNKLLEMRVMLGTATFTCSAGIVVVSTFGMNIGNDLYNGSGTVKFWETTLGTVAGCIFLYLIAISWGKKASLLH